MAHGVATRRRGLDAVRGVAIALMVVDHALAVWWPASPLRYTLTRLSLPAFGLCSGVLVQLRGRGPSRYRVVQLVAAAALVFPVWVWILKLPVPDPLSVVAATAGVWGLIRRAPWLWAVGGWVQGLYLPLPWGGWQPGYVVLWVAVGVLAAGDLRVGGQLEPSGSRTFAAAEWIGRYPLALYVGHILVLAVAVQL